MRPYFFKIYSFFLIIMRTITNFTSILLSGVLVSSSFLCGCQSSNLSASDPVTLTMWHVYGEQAQSPMNELIDEFNETVGKEKGVVIDVTLVSNASEIGQQLLDAQAGKAGAGSMPDLFTCYPGSAAALGTDNLVDWKQDFSEDELSGIVPEFLDEGIIDDQLTVFPICKSTRLLYINGTEFNRFSEATGITADSLSTWDGFFSAASAYHEWSGRPFCAFDYILQNVDFYARSLGVNAATEDRWYDTENDTFHAVWDQFAESLIRGDIIVSDQYANTQMMTGEVPAGVGSSAAILYFNNTVTYSDNTSEPMNLQVLPLPQPEGGENVAPQTGCGICCTAGDAKKEKAAAVFLRWFLDSDRNLEFAAETGYMPVVKDSFDSIDSYTFKDASYSAVYSAIRTVKDTCRFDPLPEGAGYIEKTNRFYTELRKRRSTLTQDFENGTDIAVLKQQLWDLLCQTKG